MKLISKKIIKLDKPLDVYDLTVPETENFLLENGLVVHNSSPTKWMVMQLMSLSLDKAGSTLLDGIKEFLRSCKDYREIPKRKNFKLLTPEELANPCVPWVDMGDRIVFPDKVAVRIGSRDEHGIGEDLFSVHMDEIDFKKVHSVDQVFNSYAQLTERIRSRFLGQKFTLSTLVSSITKQTGAMNKYIQGVDPNDKETTVCGFAIWEIKYPGLFEKHGYFYAMRGTRTHPSKIMEEAEKELIDKDQLEAPPGCRYIKVPANYRKDFSTNIERALMNLAGVASSVDEKPFDDLTSIEDLMLAPIGEVSAPLKSDTPLWKQLPASLWINTPQGIRLARCPSAARYMHLDLADTGEAGISMVHKERSKVSGGVMYIADFIIKVTSPNRISLESIQKFVSDLNELFGINIRKITADQYQSTGMLQFLEKNRIAEKVERLSVDRHRTQYDVLSSLISEGLFKCGKEKFLKEQLENIFISNNKPFATQGMRKDVADTICGSVYNAHSDQADQPVFYWEDLSKPKDVEEEIPEGFEEL